MYSAFDVDMAYKIAVSKVPGTLPVHDKAVEALNCLFDVAGTTELSDPVREAAQALASGLAPLYDEASALVAALALPFDKLADIANGKRVLIVPDNAICITH